MNKIKIGDRDVGDNFNPYFIADIAANHDGNIDRALKLIELAKEAGADAAKFQNFTAEKIVSKSGFAMMQSKLSHQSNWKKSVFEVYKDASIPKDWTPRLKAKCDEVRIEYMTSPYDFESIDAVDRYLQCYKIGSGDITWIEILEYIAQKGKPVILATGASTIEDVDRAVEAIEKINKQLVIMQCNTNYTASSDNFKFINLNVLKLYKEKYPTAILGLSDHTHGHTTVLGAIALGARVIEKHFTDDNSRTGPDHVFSMTPNTWREMVEKSNELFLALGDGLKRIENNEKETAVVQRRGLYYTRDLKAGHVLSEEDIAELRPIRNGQIPVFRKSDIIGKRLIKDAVNSMPILEGEM